MESILDSIKLLLGIDKDYRHFDNQLIPHINSVFMILWQLGVGPRTCFMIEDEYAIWDDFTEGRYDVNAVKTYVYLRVKLIFDPPTTSFVLDAMKRQADEMEWRLNVQVESTEEGDA